MRQAELARLRRKIAAVEAGTRSAAATLPFGIDAIDACLPGGGLALSSWHEIGGEGLEIETAAVPAAFAASLLRPLAARGEVVWVMRRDDLYPPGLAGLGFPAQRLIQVRARDEAQVLAVLEEALATSGVAAAIGEGEDISLVAGRRLQLACERSGAIGVVLRRRPFGGRVRGVDSSSASASRWRIAAAPSLPDAGEPGLGPPRWRAELLRCRGGRSGAWTLEAEETPDAAHPFHLVADLADRRLASPDRRLIA